MYTLALWQSFYGQLVCRDPILIRPGDLLTFNTVTTTKWIHGIFLHTIIIILYILSTITFAMNWAFQCHVFIRSGYNYYSAFIILLSRDDLWRAHFLVDGIIGGISTLLVDITIVCQLI